MGFSRVSNGSASNYLQVLQGTQGGKSTQFAWIQPASLGAHHTIFGNSYDAGYGWRISASNRLELFWSNGSVYDANVLSKPLLIADGAAIDYLVVGTPLFVAINVISSGPPANIEFFAGLSPSDVVSLGTVTGGPGIVNNGVQHVAIGANMFGTTPQAAFDGQWQRVGRYSTVNLTLAQLKEVAACGATPPATGLVFFYAITGDDPEPDSGPFNLDAQVFGSLPLGGDLCGTGDLEPPVADPDVVEVSEIVRQLEYLELADLLPQTCSLIPRVRLRRLDDLIQVMELTGYEFFRYTKVWQGIGEFELLINGQSEKALEMIEKGVVGNVGSPSSINNFILEVSYDGVSDFAGIIDFPSVEWMNDGTEMLRLVGPDLKRWLADRIMQPPTGLEHDSYADKQETIIKSMVDRHLINPIATDALGFNDAQRAIDYLLNATDLLRGSATTFEGRGQSLFSGVSEVANFANEFGFDFYIQNDQVIFDIFDGEDRSAFVVFDIALGNVSNFKIEWDGMNFATHALLAGQGDGVARTMRTAQTSPATYTGPRRREIFQDARDLDTEAKLLDRGTAVIRDRSRILRLSANKIMALGPCYKEDFNLGDLVTVRNSKYNVSQSVKIYEVQVIFQAKQAPQVLLTWNVPSAPSALKLVKDDIAPGSSRT